MVYPFPGHEIDTEESRDVERQVYEFRKAFYHSQGLKLESYAWAEIALDSPALPGLIAALEDLRAREIATPGSGVLSERLTEDERAHCDWYTVTDDAWAGLTEASYPTVHAWKTPAGSHALQRGTIVSERFKRVVDESRLTGLDFLWVRDIGRFQAMQWYIAVATHALGHGVDHPWFDRARAQQALTRDGIRVDPVFRLGESHFSSPVFRSGWGIGDPIADHLLTMFPQDVILGLLLDAPRRFLRDAVPHTDFAYHWWDFGGPRGPDGRRRIVHDLCLCRRAKDELVSRGLLREDQLEGVILVERTEKPGFYAYEQVDCPPPRYAATDLLQLRRDEQRFRAIFDSIERPVRRPDLKRSLSLLRKAKKNRPEDFAKPVRKASLEKVRNALPLILPSSWAKVLSISNGGEFGIGDNDCTVIPLEQLPRFHQELYVIGKESFEDYPDNYLNVGTTGGGDYFALEVEGEGELMDCPVVRFSHETCHIEQRWENIPAFLEDVLSEAE